MFHVPEPLTRPKHLPEDNWAAITEEEGRLHAALDSDDAAAVIGALKALVESVARVTKDVAGEPADSRASFDQTVKRAHELLRTQPDLNLSNEAEFSGMASQAAKMAGSLGAIRNQFGTAHGRARPPQIMDEMVELSIDGAIMWARWALRRLVPFTPGGVARSGLKMGCPGAR